METFPDSDMMPTVLHIPDGKSYDIEWSGTLHRMNHDICDCGCTEPYSPPAGTYMARVCANGTAVSWNGDLPLTEEPQVLYTAETAGPYSCVQVPFDVPGSPEVIHLEVTSTASPCTMDAECAPHEFCNECAHGSGPTLPDCVAGCTPHPCVGETEAFCDMERPDCPDANMTAIIQDGCWECSCSPW